MHLTEVQVRLCRRENCNRFLLLSLQKYINLKTNQIPAVEQTAKTQTGMHTTAQMHGLNDLSMFLLKSFGPADGQISNMRLFII